MSAKQKTEKKADTRYRVGSLAEGVIFQNGKTWFRVLSHADGNTQVRAIGTNEQVSLPSRSKVDYVSVKYRK